MPTTYSIADVEGLWSVVDGDAALESSIEGYLRKAEDIDVVMLGADWERVNRLVVMVLLGVA